MTEACLLPWAGPAVMLPAHMPSTLPKLTALTLALLLINPPLPTLDGLPQSWSQSLIPPSLLIPSCRSSCAQALASSLPPPSLAQTCLALPVTDPCQLAWDNRTVSPVFGVALGSPGRAAEAAQGTLAERRDVHVRCLQVGHAECETHRALSACAAGCSLCRRPSLSLC